MKKVTGEPKFYILRPIHISEAKLHVTAAKFIADYD